MNSVPRYIALPALILLTNTHIATASSLTEWWHKIFPPTQQETIHHEYPRSALKTIKIQNKTGNILVKSWESDTILVEIHKLGSQESINQTKIEQQQSSHELSISSSDASCIIDYTIVTPKDVALSLETTTGSITIKRIEGNIRAETDAGSIDIHESVNSITVKIGTGSLSIISRALPESAWIFAHVEKGNIALAHHFHDADIIAKVGKGTISSTSMVTLEPRTMTLEKKSWKSFQQDIKGKIGSGGAPITLEVGAGVIEFSRMP